ncbi:MAG UNVERIFIED_CONTAM: hypothetical protein LVT10_13875 [Anaerolineae bacterium]
MPRQSFNGGLSPKHDGQHHRATPTVSRCDYVGFMVAGESLSAGANRFWVNRFEPNAIAL